MNYTFPHKFNISIYIAHITYISFGGVVPGKYKQRWQVSGIIAGTRASTHPLVMRLRLKGRRRWYQHRETSMLGTENLLPLMTQKKQLER
jgi:hypothetical protein